MKKAFIILSFLALFLRCERDTSTVSPDCINKKIDEILSDRVWNPPAKIFSYLYKGQTVYFLPQRCCDIPSILYDKNCNVICNPDGGFSGMGDGKCTDFFSTRTNGRLIWEDTRN